MRQVARTKIFLFSFLVFSTANFTAGSIPIIGKEYFLRRSSITTIVAVLQAITRALIQVETK